MIQINDHLSIPESELNYTFVRSGGPGGQNVNKVNTKASLSFDVQASPSLNEDQKRLIKIRLRGRINRDGVLKLSCQESRSQASNKETVTKRFAALLREALKMRAVRRKVKTPRRVHEKRLTDKRVRSRIKQNRGRVFSD